MAARANFVEPFIHLGLAGGRLLLSRCSSCGLIVAASPFEYALVLAERLHVCPVYLNYYTDR